MVSQDWWDAESYGRLELPHMRWGNDLLARLDVDSCAVIVEIGCGTGRDTEKLALRVPDGRVVAVDRSASMLTVARSALAGKYHNIEFRYADVLQDLQMPGSCDAAFSVAALHWVEDHQAAFNNISSALKPGAVFLADCGGKGNIASVNDVVRSLLGPSDADKLSHFEDVPETEQRLKVAGFEVRDVHLQPDPARFESADVLKSFLATVVMGAHLETFEEEERNELLSKIVSLLPEMTVDYVRLRIEAVKL